MSLVRGGIDGGLLRASDDLRNRVAPLLRCSVLKRPVSGENTVAPALAETVTDITSANHMRVGAVRPAWDTVGEFDSGRRMTLRGAAADRSSGLR